MIRTMVGCLITLSSTVGCDTTANTGGKERVMTYAVHRFGVPLTIDADWDKAVWKNVETIELTHYMGDRPKHFPRVRAKMLYDADALYVIFHVEDQYVRAVAQKHQDPVCRDSCVEFFFVPGMDDSAGYFNIEMNCGGTMLANFQIIPREDAIQITPADLERIQVARTLPRTVDPELTEPTTWTVAYRMPTDILAKYCPSATKPAPGVTWRANFYKCGDQTSQPHWAMWNEIPGELGFHKPEHFAPLRFE